MRSAYTIEDRWLVVDSSWERQFRRGTLRKRSANVGRVQEIQGPRSKAVSQSRKIMVQHKHTAIKIDISRTVQTIQTSFLPSARSKLRLFRLLRRAQPPKLQLAPLPRVHQQINQRRLLVLLQAGCNGVLELVGRADEEALAAAGLGE
jgi:hypothetical protein